jgi:hypothetical protein
MTRHHACRCPWRCSGSYGPSTCDEYPRNSQRRRPLNRLVSGFGVSRLGSSRRITFGRVGSGLVSGSRNSGSGGDTGNVELPQNTFDERHDWRDL